MDIETGLDNLLRGQFDAALAVFESCGQHPAALGLCRLTRACADLSAYAAALSEGDFSVHGVTVPAFCPACEIFFISVLPPHMSAIAPDFEMPCASLCRAAEYIFW